MAKADEDQAWTFDATLGLLVIIFFIAIIVWEINNDIKGIDFTNLFSGIASSLLGLFAILAGILHLGGREFSSGTDAVADFWSSGSLIFRVGLILGGILLATFAGCVGELFRCVRVILSKFQ